MSGKFLIELYFRLNQLATTFKHATFTDKKGQIWLIMIIKDFRLLFHCIDTWQSVPQRYDTQLLNCGNKSFSLSSSEIVLISKNVLGFQNWFCSGFEIELAKIWSISQKNARFDDFLHSTMWVVKLSNVSYVGFYLGLVYYLFSWHLGSAKSQLKIRGRLMWLITLGQIKSDNINRLITMTNAIYLLIFSKWALQMWWQ